jgi:hypothetical protein
MVVQRITRYSALLFFAHKRIMFAKIGCEESRICCVIVIKNQSIVTSECLYKTSIA